MNKKNFAIIFSILLVSSDLVRGASIDTAVDPLVADNSCVSSPCAPPPLPVTPPSTTTRVPCTPRPCTATQLVITLPNPCNPCLPVKPLPPPPPKPAPLVLPTLPTCQPICPPVKCAPACPQTCNPCGGAVAPAPVSLWPTALKGLKVWKIGTAALTAPVALAGAKIAGTAALLPAKLALKGAIIGGLIAKPIILGTALVTAGAAKVAATVVGIPVAIVTGIKMAALKLGSLFSNARTQVSNVLSTPLSIANGVKLVALGKGAQALAQFLDRAGRTAVDNAQTLASYGSATQALGNDKLVWGFDDLNCNNLYVLQPVQETGAAVPVSNLVDEEEDIFVPAHEAAVHPAPAPVSVVQVNTAQVVST